MWCWWCCHPYDTEPLSLPYGHDELRNKFSTTGNFCSWSCMKSYAIDRYGINKGSIICGNIVMMRRRMYGHSGSVRPAPNRYRLKVFGGDMTIEEFRAACIIDREKRKPVESEPTRDVVVPFISNARKTDEIKNTDDSLVLKRNKPLKRNQNSLESALGLIINPPRNPG
jgi:hypothetical protein